MATSIDDQLLDAVSYIKKAFVLEDKPLPKVAIVLGSGLYPFADDLKKTKHAAHASFNQIPHFSPSSVSGHKGELIYAMVDNEIPIFALSGRLHLYEGHAPDQVIFPARVLGKLGVTAVILTNAAGAIGEQFEPGHLMVISDHLNLTGTSALIGKNCESLGPRFVDMSYAYDDELREFAKKAAIKADIIMHEGIYAGLLGPCYETPAEVRMIKRLGASAVGMSTVFETIALRHMGIKVLGISCLTNKAAGLSTKKISHEEVMEINAQVVTKLSLVLTDVVKMIAN